MFQDALPIQKQIEEAAKAANSKYPADTMAEGWIAGMVIEAALKSAGWPATPAKIQAAMEKLKVDLQGLRGGPIVWTKDNHFRTEFLLSRLPLGWRQTIARVQDWKAYEVK